MKIVSTSAPRSYRGPVSSKENRAAHGGTEVTETREDGRIRRVNINGHHREEGPWAQPPKG